jgi:hypothetical protein
MPRIARVTVTHHITQRGNRKQKTYFNNDSFLTRLENSLGRFLKTKSRDESLKETKIGMVSPEFLVNNYSNLMHNQNDVLHVCRVL